MWPTLLQVLDHARANPWIPSRGSFATIKKLTSNPLLIALESVNNTDIARRGSGTPLASHAPRIN